MDPFFVLAGFFFVVGILSWLFRKEPDFRAEYGQMLRTPQWYRRKLQYYARHRKHCAKRSWFHWGRIELHHLYYVWGRPPWAYPDFALEPRCRWHHPKEGTPFLKTDPVYVSDFSMR